MEVVSASHGVLGPLLGKLTRLLAGEYGRMRGVRGEILSLKSELTCMHAALNDYTMLEDPNVQVKTWISLLRELAYDTEDCIDKFIRRLGNGRRHGGFKEFFRTTACTLKTLGSRSGIADQIDELKARVKLVKELKNSYRLDDTPSSTSSHAAVDPRLHALFAEEAHLVGVDGPRDDLAKWIVEEKNSSSKNQRRVLSIVGFGGLGKTTLAYEVYRKIQEHFDCRAFVSVSQKPVLKKIIKDVISQVIPEDEFKKLDTDDWDEKRSIEKLRELLQDKRYLVIIDDIWSTEVWNTIKCAFPENNRSSRIIATTRIVDVARSCCPDGDDRVYEMEALSDLHSKRLFHKRIFGCEDSCPNMLKEVSNEILKKCGGLPLAIISISGLLANKPTCKDEWEKVKRSIGSALEKNRSLEGMYSILSLSYNDLPPNLKTCLLYLSIFPEDYVIERERLVRRWIAEGFISEVRGQSRQEVAENYFYDLINKSMIQPVDIAYDGKARACRVHDMMLEIIISKSVEDNFITVVGGGQMSLANRQGFIRRLSVQHIDQELAFVLADEDLSHVRSLSVMSSASIKHLPSLAEFEALRVLDFEDCEGLEEYIMKGMDNLFQVKYLRLSNRAVSKLPSGIEMLGDLETLDLRGTSVRELPTGIVRLIKLRHLIGGRYGIKIPNGIGNMRNLQVISGFSITESSIDAVEELGNLTNLGELNLYFDGEGSVDLYFDSEGSDVYKKRHFDSEGSDVYKKRHEEMLLSALCKLSSYKLQSLLIRRYGGSLEFLDSWSPIPFSLQIFYMFSNYYFMNIPKWITPALASLAFLDINLTELGEEVLHAIGELPALLCLRLSFKTGSKERLTVQGTGFPSLKEFGLENLEKYIAWRGAYITFVKGAMPKLEKLDVPFNVSWAKTYGFYLGIEHLPCLKVAEIRLRNVGATSSESKAAAAAIRKEAGAHPNHPTVFLSLWGESYKEYNEETGSDEDDGNIDEN